MQTHFSAEQLADPALADAIANAHQRLARRIYTEYGFEYICEYVAGARFARGLHVLVFNREDEAERQRADACYRALAEAFAAEGYSVGRAATGYQALRMSHIDPDIWLICMPKKAGW